jgi:hypothetical protein
MRDDQRERSVDDRREGGIDDVIGGRCGWSAPQCPSGGQEREDWVRRVVERLYDEHKPMSEGEPADYIPGLANIGPDAFAIPVATPDGRRVGAGDGSARAARHLPIATVVVVQPAVK